ncbi:FAD-binding protein [Bacillus sp. T3]|uniref:FAD-binding protein n=1 Tax=Bacillus sp. T3 TaxID=467262 RepID=UPI0029822B77|nr:FAD-binding protein [Bacillus sp. T3]
MQILKNEHLKKYTSVKIGGYAKNLYFPESSDELVELLNNISNNKYYILSGGSNILMNDQKTYEHVISMKKMDTTIKHLGNGKFYVGASAKLQQLIDTINKEGYGGIEYLYSLPALVGGSIAMNAGRGQKSGLSISDYIEEVFIYDQGNKKVLSKEECDFKYRYSNFKGNKSIILGATFTFKKVDINNSTELKKQRMKLVKEEQDKSGYNFGSVFRERNTIIMHLFKLFHPGYKNGMAFSNMTANWLLNKGEGTYDQAITLIKLVERLHKIIGKKAIPEVIIWK